MSAKSDRTMNQLYLAGMVALIVLAFWYLFGGGTILGQETVDEAEARAAEACACPEPGCARDAVAFFDDMIANGLDRIAAMAPETQDIYDRHEARARACLASLEDEDGAVSGRRTDNLDD